MKSPLILLLLIVYSIAFSQESSKEVYQNRISELTDKIARESSNLALYYARADAYDVLDKFEQSNLDYLKITELYRRNPDANYTGEFTKSCYRLADEYFFRQANPEKAMKYVAEGLKVSPGFKDLEVLDAILTGLDANKRDLATEKYNAVSRKYADDVRLNLYYGKFLQTSDPLAAATRYEQALAADPLNREAILSAGTIYNNEATLLSGQGKEPDKVFEYAKKASVYFERLYKMNPENKEVVNILLRLYDELGQQEKADMLKSPY